MAGSQTIRIFDHLGASGARILRVAGGIKAGLEALRPTPFDEPWRPHRPTYDEWQDYIAPRPREPRARD